MQAMRLWRKRDTKKQLTSISVSLTGVTLSWEAHKSERRRAWEILHHLEDHRALYDPHAASLNGRKELIVASIERLRLNLGERIPQCESVELRDKLREIQAAVREFLTATEDPTRSVWCAVELLRERVGVAVDAVGDIFGIPIDGDLARILPPDVRRRLGLRRHPLS
jgi:hypothetical protein